MQERSPFPNRGGTRKKLTHTLLGERGIDLDPGSFVLPLREKWGLPILDDTLGIKYAPPERGELERILNVVIRSGGGRFVHPDLLGIEFKNESIEKAISLFSAADRELMDGSAPETENPAVSRMAENKSFMDATFEENRREQLRIALYNTAVLERADQLVSENPGMTPEEADDQARNDVAVARTLIDEFRLLKSGELDSGSASAEAERMHRLYRNSEFGNELSAYGLALKVIDNPVEFAEPVSAPEEKPVVVEQVEEEQPVVEIEVPEKPVEVREPVRNLVVVKRTLESGEDRTFHLDLLSQDG
ncbi:hypothetical protein GF318_01395, partial [Candidatus Micrarchaeota archaeon]|nr:hypothetical protein [Candidatus Micrarchaeota archaeon]